MHIQTRDHFTKRVIALILCAIMMVGLFPSNFIITAQAASAVVSTIPNTIKLTNYDDGKADGEKVQYTSDYGLGTVTFHEIGMSNESANYAAVGFCFNKELGLKSTGNTWYNSKTTSEYAHLDSQMASILDIIKPFLNIYYYATATEKGKTDVAWNDGKARAFNTLAQIVVWHAKAGTLNDMSDRTQIDMLAREMQKAIKAINTKLGAGTVTNGGAEYNYEQCVASIDHIMEYYSGEMYSSSREGCCFFARNIL